MEDSNLATLLTQEDFHDPVHGEIFKACQDLYHGNNQCDFVLLVEKAEKIDSVARLGGVGFLAGLITEDLPLSSSEAIYKVLKRKRAQRESLNISEESRKLVFQDVTAIPSYLAEKAQKMAEFIPRVGNIQHEDMIAELTAEHSTIPIGINGMDLLTGGGLGPGDMMIVAARPSVGKSSLATTIMANMLHNKRRACFFSLEMSKKQVFSRLLSAYHKKPVKETKKDIVTYVKAIETPFEVIAKMYEITAIQAEMMASEAEIFIIDYISLISMQSREGQFQKLNEISKSIKRLANQIEKPVIVLAQLSREIEKDKTNREPQLSDLWGGGEADPDIITFLWDPNYKETIQEDKKSKAIKETTKVANELEGKDNKYEEGELHWIIRKHRNGPTGKIYLKFHKELFLMEEKGNFGSSTPIKHALPF